MGTLVAPMGSATVAMPAANRLAERNTALVLPARLNIVEDDADTDELEGVKGGGEDQDVPAESGGEYEYKAGLSFFGPHPPKPITAPLLDKPLRLAECRRQSGRHTRASVGLSGRVNPRPLSPRTPSRRPCGHAASHSNSPAALVNLVKFMCSPPRLWRARRG